MFSGKSTSMLSEFDRYLIAKKPCLAIKHTRDNRYIHGSGNLVIKTHAGREYCNGDMVQCSKLSDINKELINKVQVIGVSEAQFFDDLIIVVEWANMGKTIILECLNGDYMQNQFENVSTIIPHVDEIHKLSAICMICYDDNKPANFTIRISNEKDQIVIGGADKYKCVCRSCLIEFNSMGDTVIGSS
jgi:thymidine kinase